MMSNVYIFIDYNGCFIFQKNSSFSYSKIGSISKTGFVWTVLGESKNAYSNIPQMFKKIQTWIYSKMHPAFSDAP